MKETFTAINFHSQHFYLSTLVLSLFSTEVKKTDGEYMMDEERNCRTWFVRNALPRYRAPIIPIRLSPRFNVVSVCGECRR